MTAALKKKRKEIKEVHWHCMHALVHVHRYTSVYMDQCTYTHLCTYTHPHKPAHKHTHTHGKKHMHTNTDLYKPLVNSIVSQACFTLVVHKHARGLEKKKKSE